MLKVHMHYIMAAPYPPFETKHDNELIHWQEMYPSKGIFLSSNPNTSLGPLYIFPVQAFFKHLHQKMQNYDFQY